MKNTWYKGVALLVLCLICLSGLQGTVTAHAAENTNVTMQSATPIAIGETVTATFSEGEEGYLYYKLTIPEDIGNQWINVASTSYANRGYFGICLCDEQDHTLKSDVHLGKNESSIFHTRTEGAASSSSITTLTPGATYYIEITNYASAYGGDCVVSVSSVPDDNWGTFDKAETISCDQQKAGTLEYEEDIDCYAVVLPNDNRKYTFVLGAQECSINALFADGDTIKLDDVNVSANSTDNSFSVTGRGQKIYVKIQENTSSFQTTRYTLNVVGESASTEASEAEAASKAEAASAAKKTISTFKLTKYKRNTKKITGRTISGAKVKVKVRGKSYVVRVGKKGTFRVKLNKKLKKNTRIRVTVSKANYTTRRFTFRVK